MDYPFECKKCGHQETISMKMTEYTADGHKCPECGSDMSRTVESLVCGMSIDNTGTFYRKYN